MSYKQTFGYMIHQLASTLDTASDKILRSRFDLGLAQFRILLVLEEQEGIQQRQIAEELSQTEASVSRQIKILARRGLVEIEGNPNNRRERRIYQTQQGHELAIQSIKALNDYHQPIFDSLGEEEQSRLAATLQKLSDKLTE